MSALTARGSTRRWRRIRAYVLERDGHRCQLRPDRTPETWGQPLGLAELAPRCGAWADCVDHIVSRKLGGTDEPSNLRASCSPCNMRRGAGEDRPPTGSRPGSGWSW